MLRSSCSKCHFTNFKRPSDFTLADYWGWEKLSPNFNKDNKGCSLLFINTEKGQEIFKNIRKKLHYLLTSQELCIQPNLQHPSHFDSHYIKFELLYVKKGFLAVAQRYGNLGWKYKMQQLKQNLVRMIKKIIKL